MAIYVGDYAAGSRVYSVGFDETLDQPEVIAFDLQRGTASAFVSMVFRELKAGTLVFEDGKIWPDGEKRPGAWRKVHPSRIYGEADWMTFAVARRFRRTGRNFGLEAFQFVLPDSQGLFPWEPGYDEQLRRLQPSLYLTEEEEKLATPAPV